MSAMLLSPAQVAQRLQVKERTVSEWLKSGKLRGSKVGRLWRVPPENLDEFLGKKTSAWKPSLREYTDEEIAQFLEDDKLDEEMTRRVEQLLGSASDETSDYWMRGVAREWHEDLADERQDIYSLEDGEPVNASR